VAGKESGRPSRLISTSIKSLFVIFCPYEVKYKAKLNTSKKKEGSGECSRR
jgi:hypothetical protein